MDTKAKLETDLKDAMRRHDELRKQTLRLALSTIRLAEVEKGTSIDEAGVITILQKEVKAYQESVEDARRASRPDLEETAKAEIAILEEYLPRQFSPAELEALVKQVIAETNASSLREIGQVMKILLPRLEGHATGDQANQMVRKFLS